MSIPVKTQHENRTGHDYVKRAHIAKSRAGLPEVWADADTQLTLTDYGHLVVSRLGDEPFALSISERDQAKMRRLEAQK